VHPGIFCLALGAVIYFDPVTYTVPEGNSTMLRIVRVGNANILSSVTISTVVGTAGDKSVNWCACFIAMHAVIFCCSTEPVTLVISVSHFRVG